MRQAGLQVAVGEGAKDGAGDGGEHYGEAVADEGEERAGAGAGDGPADAEERPAGGVADAAVHAFGRDDDGLAVDGFDLPALDDFDRQHGHGEGAGDDEVHARGVEAEHLLDTEPGEDFGLREGDAEGDAQEEVDHR